MHPSMKSKRPLRRILGVTLLLLSGCDVVQNARSDFGKATNASAAATQSKPSPASTQVRRAETKASDSTNVQDPAKREPPKPQPPRDAATATPVGLVGKSEGEVRALLGPPTSEEDRAPGKTWHYRDGLCTVDIQLYPDVQTHQFGTLAYEVKSDDNTDEGKRLCMAQLMSHARARGGS